MKISSRLKGGIYGVSFGYNPKMEGYMTLMSDIPELSEIAYKKRCYIRAEWNPKMNRVFRRN